MTLSFPGAAFILLTFMSGFCLCITMDGFKPGDLGMLPNVSGQVCSLPQPDRVFRWSLGSLLFNLIFLNSKSGQSEINTWGVKRSKPVFVMTRTFCENRPKAFIFFVFKTWSLVAASELGSTPEVPAMLMADLMWNNLTLQTVVWAQLCWAGQCRQWSCEYS